MGVHFWTTGSRYWQLFLISVVIIWFQGSVCAISKTSVLPSPTEAYLSDPKLQEKVNRAFASYRKNAVLFALEKLILEREKKYSVEYCVFYHAQKNDFRIIHDFLKELYTLLDGVSHGDEYNYLRPRHKVLSAVDVNAFIDEREKGKAVLWCDSAPDLVQNMLCVNLSLFGNTSQAMNDECTYNFFVRNSSICSPPVKEILQDICKHHSVNTACIDMLLELNKKIKTSEGTLFQICIPKDKVDKYVYLSHEGGTPFREPLLSDYFDINKRRHTRILPILEQYCTNIEKLSCADILQARLVFDQQFLNPDSGIKVFRYTTVPADKMQAYRAELKAIVTKACHA